MMRTNLLTESPVLHLSPARQVVTTTPFLTPQPERATIDSPEKRVWSVAFKGTNASRPIIYSSASKRLFREEPPPLLDSLVGQLNLVLEDFTKLIAEYSTAARLTSVMRKSLDKRKKSLVTKMGEITGNILYLMPPSEFASKYSCQMQTLIKSLNEHTSFFRRLKILSHINSKVSIDEDSGAIWRSVKDFDSILLQLKLEENLKLLGINHIPITALKLDSNRKTRVIFTDAVQSNIGFYFIIQWLRNFANPFHAVEENKRALRQAGPKRIISNLKEQGIVCNDIEIAWGHIMNDGRHNDENIVFVSSIQALTRVIEHITPDSTFILDCHGGANQLNIAGARLQGEDLRKYIANIAKLLGKNITHVILSTCKTGVLTLDEVAETASSKSPRKTKYCMQGIEAEFRVRHKNRKKIFIDVTDISTMFENLSLNMQSLACYFANLVLNRRNQSSEYGSAFTFSPSLLYPDNDGGGVICVPASNSERLDWPCYHESWEKDETGKDLSQIALKSITLYNNPNNKKALGSNGEWKKLGFRG